MTQSREAARERLEQDREKATLRLQMAGINMTGNVETNNALLALQARAETAERERDEVGREMIDLQIARDGDGFLGSVTEWATFIVSDRDQALARVSELEGEVERLTGERDEALQQPWPVWAERIHKTLAKYDAVEPGEEVDLPLALECFIEQWDAANELEQVRIATLTSERDALKAEKASHEAARALLRSMVDDARAERDAALSLLGEALWWVRAWIIDDLHGPAVTQAGNLCAKITALIGEPAPANSIRKGKAT